MTFKEATMPAVVAMLVAAALTSTVVIPNILFFFHNNPAELGDYATNALQIRNAKHGLELYGNYSRWGFYHPGPFFWYLYAAGEFFIHDALKLTSIHASHMLTSAIFQCACVATAIVYLGKRTSLVVIPIAVALLYWHWNKALGAPTSIWPPHVLFGPFLLLVVFGTAVASGAANALPCLIFAGGVLLHSHVAQPLFVIPIGLIAIFGLAKSVSAWRSQALLSAAIALVFIAPIAIDAMHGRQSNIAKILSHMVTHTGDKHTLEQGLGYFLSFFTYSTDHIVIGAADFSLRAFVSARPGIFIGVIAILALIILPFTRFTSTFLKWYALITTVTVVLSVMWGAMQDGEMYDFNGNFIYVVIYLVYLFPFLVVFEQSQSLATKLLSGLVLAITFSLVTPKPLFTTYIMADAAFMKDFRQLISAARNDTVKIDFTSQHWIEGIAVVNLIDSLGFNYVPPSGYDFLNIHNTPKESATLTLKLCAETGLALPSLIGVAPSPTCYVEASPK